MMGVGYSYGKRQRKWVRRPECGVGLDQGSMMTHLLGQYGWIKRSVGKGKAVVNRKSREGEGAETEDVGEAYREYRVASSRGIAQVQYPVEGCPGT